MITKKKKAEMVRYNRKIVNLIVSGLDFKCEFQVGAESISIDFWHHTEKELNHLSLSSFFSTQNNERRFQAISTYIQTGQKLPKETQF